MKVLYLEPRMDVGQKISEALKARGLAILLATNPAEAKQLLQLHGRSIDLAVIHREGPYGTGDPGLRFISTFKAEATHADLPYILTSAQWSDADCAAHQSTPMGANAYVTQINAEKILAAIEAVSGQNF